MLIQASEVASTYQQEVLALPELKTNRDLYLAIEKLLQSQESCDRTLEQYLLALLHSAHPFADSNSLSLSNFHNLIAQSFTSHPYEFDENWRNLYDQYSHESPDFNGWKSTVIRQIVDLREMDENGALADEQRYFGIDSPRNSRWYNFDTSCYIECAMAGSFGGWEPGDATGREFVPELGTVRDDEESLQQINPEDIQRPRVPVIVVTWEQFKDFVYCGQIYE